MDKEKRSLPVIPAREALNRASGGVAGIQVADLSLWARAHNARWFNLDSGEQDQGAATARRAGMTEMKGVPPKTPTPTRGETVSPPILAVIFFPATGM